MLKGGYTFQKNSVALPYWEVHTGVAANEARALRAHSHMALISQNADAKLVEALSYMYKHNTGSSCSCNAWRPKSF